MTRTAGRLLSLLLPRLLLQRAAESLKSGGGFPFLDNDDAIIAGYVRAGVPLEDAREYANSNCWETLIAGRSDQELVIRERCGKFRIVPRPPVKVGAQREQLERHHKEMVDEMRRAQDAQGDLAKEALRTQRDAAGAVAAGRRGMGEISGRTPTSGDQIICRKCSTAIVLQPLLKFCPKCGEPIS